METYSQSLRILGSDQQASGKAIDKNKTVHEKMYCQIRTGHEIFSEVWKVVENNAPLEIWMTTMMSLFKLRSTS